MMRVTIFGFGLIGGSLALALRASGRAFHVTAVDAPAVLNCPEAQGAADAWVDFADEEQVARALHDSQLAVLATPVAVICERLPWVLERTPIVTDCGSTKRSAVAAGRASPRAGRYVPGHPMAGLPGGGIRRASAEIFLGQNWILCPEGVDSDALACLDDLIALVGARRVDMTPSQHDAAVARTSHLPQLIASALAVIVERNRASAACGPAYERATRTAGGPAPIWHDIFASNSDQIAAALAELCAELQPIADELSRSSTARAELLLAHARELRTGREK